MTVFTTIAEFFVDAWPAIFAIDLIRYVVAAGAVALVLAVFARPLASRRIQQRSATRNDVRREISYSISTAFLFSLVGFSVYVGGSPFSK